MDGARFDSWTRRRCGHVAAGALATLFGLDAERAVLAGPKRKKRHKRRRKRQCEKPRSRCNPHNDKKLCCPGHACDIVPELGGHRCCRLRFASCQDDGDCCGHLICTGSPDGFCDLSGQ